MFLCANDSSLKIIKLGLELNRKAIETVTATEWLCYVNSRLYTWEGLELHKVFASLAAIIL